ncbi:FAS1 [Glarea lozoyensis ATCC 20868]|uniref:FAS1 n=2 Tax=Glarea lozoyensis TaxID=101852 RepID=S3E1T9_GLAL2|nr:FAS1 [Glarea lozoyensis ATCC 20868]EPE32448.1 FAS1 [Glarea lozoyensis ATCC 20868]
MQLKSCLPLALGAIASAQSLTDVLANNTAELSTLISLLSAQPAIVSALGSASDITILAPNNAAFAAFLATPEGTAAGGDPSTVAALLTYHVVNGTFYASDFSSTPAFAPTLLSNTTFTNVTGGQVVEAVSDGTNVTILSGLLAESKVVAANLNFTGGTVHVIDKVLTIPQAAGATAVTAGLTNLVGALTRADLVNAVQGLSDVTIFAPSNAAFDAIGSATANLSVADLAGILTYHVVNGTVGYSSALTNTSLTALNGGSIDIRIEGENVFVNSAKVVTPNVLIANGVVHVIDNVLNPNPASGSATSTGVAFPGATSVSSTVFTEAPTPSTTLAGAGATPTSSGAASSSLSAGAAGRAFPTGAIEMAALLGGAGVLMNL